MRRSWSLLLAVLMLLMLTAGCAGGQKPAPGMQPSQQATEGPLPTPAPQPSVRPTEKAQPTPTPAPEPTPMPEPSLAPAPTPAPSAAPAIDERGSYTSKEDVALYIHTYGHLPDNYITKKEAERLGWRGGSLERYAPGKVIGGSRFGNYEGLLPERPGRVYTECDIDTLGKSKRGAKRIVFSSDGLIYYTDDHYESFTLLYGEEDA